MRRTLLDLLTATTAAAAVAGALVYAVIWWGYLSFYSRLGLLPSDVGLDQSAIIRTAALGLCLFAALIVPVGVVYWLVVSGVFRVLRWVLRRSAPSPSGRLRRLLTREDRVLPLTVASMALVLSAPFVMLRLADYVFAAPYRNYVWSAVLALAAVIGYTGYQRERGRLDLLSLSIAWAGALGVVFYASILFLNTRGDDLVNNLINGRGPYDSTFIFQVSRESVCVDSSGHWQRAVLLGESDRGVVLFDPATQVVLRPSERPSIAFHLDWRAAC